MFREKQVLLIQPDYQQNLMILSALDCHIFMEDKVFEAHPAKRNKYPIDGIGNNRFMISFSLTGIYFCSDINSSIKLTEQRLNAC